VVAVTDGEEHHRRLLGHAVASRKRRRVGERVQRPCHALASSGVDRVSGDATASKHQFGFVQLREPLALGADRFDHRAVRVVDQHQDVRHLELGAAPDLDPRSQALDHRPFGRAYRARGLAAEIVLLEIELQHEPAADAIAERSLDVNGACVCVQHAVGEIAPHRVLDSFDARRGVRFPQVRLGEDQVQCRRRVANHARDAVPVLRLGGVLIAGDHGPLREIDSRAWEKNPRQSEASPSAHVR
jgi:hypothetical protein